MMVKAAVVLEAVFQTEVDVDCGDEGTGNPSEYVRTRKNRRCNFRTRTISQETYSR